MGEMLGLKEYALDLLNLESVLRLLLLWIGAVQIKNDWLYCIVRMQNGTIPTDPNKNNLTDWHLVHNVTLHSDYEKLISDV